jgi:transitional endoplasmic reticulum ATPase
MGTKDENMRQLKVKEALPKDVGRAIARIDPEEMKGLGLEVGQIVEIEGKRKTAAKAMPCYAEDRGKKIVQIDGITRENAKVGLDEKVTLQKSESEPAKKITLAPLTDGGGLQKEKDAEYIGSLIEGLPLTRGDKIRARLFGTKTCDFMVEDTVPDGVVSVSSATQIRVKSKEG